MRCTVGWCSTSGRRETHTSVSFDHRRGFEEPGLVPTIVRVMDRGRIDPRGHEPVDSTLIPPISTSTDAPTKTPTDPPADPRSTSAQTCRVVGVAGTAPGGT